MSMNNEQDILIERIIKAYNEDNLTFFIGAGISKTVKNSKAKFWKDLVKEMHDILGEEGKDENDPLVLAQFVYMQNQDEYKRIIEEAIDNRKISEVHELIAKLQPKTIITTNWDCLIEKALEYSFYDVIACDKDLLVSRRERKVIKMHGDIRHKNIVFKEDDYINYSNRFPLIENYVKTVLCTSNVIFLGYSYNDINLKIIMNWIKEHDRKGNKFLYVMTGFGEYTIRNKYYEEEWKIKTYFCNDKGVPENVKNLEDDNQHQTYAIYNFLYSLVNYKEKYQKKYILDMIDRYKPLSYVPNYILEGIFPNANSEIYSIDGRKILSFQLYSHKKYDVFREIFKQENKRNYHIEIEELYDFLEKSKVNDFAILDFLSSKGEKIYDVKDHIIDAIGSSIKYNSDINKYLKFDLCINYEKYQFDREKRKLKTYISRGKYLNAILEIFRMSTYIRLKGEISDQSLLGMLFQENINKILPKNIIIKYKLIIDKLSFKDIERRSQELINFINFTSISMNINNKLNVGKEYEISRVNDEMIDLIYFSKINKICIDCYDEVRKYFYLCLRYIFLLQYLNYLTSRSKNIDFDIKITKIQLYVMIEYCHLFDVFQFAKDMMLKHNNGFVIIERSDFDWVVHAVLPSLVKSIERYNDVYHIDFLCESKLGVIVLIVACAININKKDVVTLIRQLSNIKSMVMINLFIDCLSILYNKWKDKLDEHNELLDEIYHYYNGMLH